MSGTPRDPLRHTDIDPAGRSPEPSLGADEEGEAKLPRAAVTGDKAAWVHVDDADAPTGDAPDQDSQV